MLARTRTRTHASAKTPSPPLTRVECELRRARQVSAGTLAYHFELAAIGMDTSELDVPACKRAIWFLKVAAEEAMKVNAIDDANRYLSRCHDLMQLLPSKGDPFDLEMALGLVDGNEVLLRQVLDQFRYNTEMSMAKIENCVLRYGSGDVLALASPRGLDESDASRNAALPAMRAGTQPCSDATLQTSEAARFEARSIASAASTLGAEAVSHAALAVESAVVDLSNLDKVQEAIQKLKVDFVQLITFVNSHTSAKTATSVVPGLLPPHALFICSCACPCTRSGRLLRTHSKGRCLRCLCPMQVWLLGCGGFV
jgi:hypothetical protein